MKLEDGSQETYYSDEAWYAMINGPIRFAEIYEGEIYDARMEMPGWSETGYSKGNWENVAVEEIDPSVKLMPKRHHPVRNVMTLNAKSISQLESGAVIFDLGQNMVGVPKIKVPMIENDTLTIRFAEMLQQDGQLYTANYRTAKSTDYYIAGATGIAEYSPKFTFHGFRYVELSGFDSGAVPDTSWVTGLVQHSDFDIVGTFTSSHDKLNQLQSNIEWGLRGNFFDIPTDCPQRDERAGWTGDAQVFAPTSYCIADVHSFWMSWLQSVREEQFDNGAIPIVVPNIAGERISQGWGDVATIIPWEAYIRTGDKKTLKENFAMMKRWVGFYQSNAKDNIVNLYGFGDWLQPYSSGGNRGDTSMDILATAFYAQSVRLTMKAAEVLGYEEDELELKALLAKVRAAFEKNFFDTDGRIKDRKETQTGYLLAIGFDLLSEETTEKAIPHLLRQIEKADNHLRTGFLGTPLLAPVLDKIGQNDLMYEVLFKETYPSWFYSINQGATTMWERWNSYSYEDGFGDAGMNSFNHYAYGAIGQWMHERIAGIGMLEPGYKKIRIAPEPGGPLTSARGTYESPYGSILAEWQIANDQFSLHVQIPPNTTAEIVTPSIGGEDIMVARKEISAIKGVTKTWIQDDRIMIEVLPGTYNFLTPYLNGNGKNKNKGRSNFFPIIEQKPKTIPEKENVWVFILAGQSNMAGRGLVEPQDTIPNERILTINQSNDVILAKEPLNYYEPNMRGLDCGHSFANTLLDEVPDSISILVIPTAVGGSSINQWINDSTHRNISLYSNFRDKLKIGQRYGMIKGVLWHQGESDAATKETIDAYSNQLKKLFGLFRNEAGNSTLPILIGELGSFSIWNENWQALNKKIREYIETDTNTYLIKTTDLKHKGDKVHFDSDGQRKMGKRFAEKYLEIQE